MWKVRERVRERFSKGYSFIFTLKRRLDLQFYALIGDSIKCEKYRFQTLCEKYRFQTTRANNNMSSSSDREYRTATIGGIFASTPIDDVPARNYTTSLSQIGTTSSLSGDRTEDGLQSQTASKDLLCRRNYIFINSSHYEQILLFHKKLTIKSLID